MGRAGKDEFESFQRLKRHGTRARAVRRTEQTKRLGEHGLDFSNGDGVGLWTTAASRRPARSRSCSGMLSASTIASSASW